MYAIELTGTTDLPIYFQRMTTKTWNRQWSEPRFTAMPENVKTWTTREAAERNAAKLGDRDVKVVEYDRDAHNARMYAR